MSKIKILIVDDEQNIRRIMQNILNDEGYVTMAVENGRKALEQVRIFNPNIVLLDKNMPIMGGMETLIEIRKKHPEISIIMITAYGDIQTAVTAMKWGAYDYLEKPFDNSDLIHLIAKAARHSQNARSILSAGKPAPRYSTQHIIGHSPIFLNLLEQIKNVSRTDATVMITGESGTGKELIARAVHDFSDRKEKPFVAINCGAIPMQLLESELFGYEKGAFTDAKESRKGKLEQAHTGTLFLDEIGELPLEGQVKLLRVLEQKNITRLGGRSEIPVDVRFIAATNRNLEEKVKEGSFRLDLLYRLNIFTVRMPSLSERTEDIPLLADHFIEKYNAILKTSITGFTKEALYAIQSYSWPGNIRDLENAVQSGMIMAHTGKIDTIHLPDRVFKDKMSPSESKNSDSFQNNLEENEKELISRALHKCQFNRTNAANELGVSRKTLFNKMKKYNLLP